MQDPIEEYLVDVKSSGKSEGTFRVRRRDLRKYDAYLEERGLNVTEVREKDVHRFLREQGLQYADNTVDKVYDSVKLLYDYLTGIGDLMDEDDHPLEELKRSEYSGNGKDKSSQGEVVYVTPEEVKLLCENVPDGHALRDELIIRLMFQTGVRAGELVNITLDDMDREERSIEVHAQKTDTTRTVYWQPSLDFLLDQWIDGGYRDALVPSEYLFPTNQSEHLTVYRLNTMIRVTAKEAGVQEVMYEDAAGNPRRRVTPHALRHGHAVEALKSGIDVRRVQAHLGHEKLDTTMQYLRVIDEDVKQAFQRFGTRPDDEGTVA